MTRATAAWLLAAIVVVTVTLVAAMESAQSAQDDTARLLVQVEDLEAQVQDLWARLGRVCEQVGKAVQGCERSSE